MGPFGDAAVEEVAGGTHRCGPAVFLISGGTRRGGRRRAYQPRRNQPFPQLLGHPAGRTRSGRSRRRRQPGGGGRRFSDFWGSPPRGKSPPSDCAPHESAADCVEIEIPSGGPGNFGGSRISHLVGSSANGRNSGKFHPTCRKSEKPPITWRGGHIASRLCGRLRRGIFRKSRQSPGRARRPAGSAAKGRGSGELRPICRNSAIAPFTWA